MGSHAGSRARDLEPLRYRALLDPAGVRFEATDDANEPQSIEVLLLFEADTWNAFLPVREQDLLPTIMRSGRWVPEVVREA